MSTENPRAQALEQALQDTFAPTYLVVENESHRHNVPPGSESHFKLTVVSAAFAGKRPVARHQQVYAAVAPGREQGIHALAIHTYTPEEWAEYYDANVNFFDDIGSPGGAAKMGVIDKDHPLVAALPPQA